MIITPTQIDGLTHFFLVVGSEGVPVEVRIVVIMYNPLLASFVPKQTHRAEQQDDQD
jgi:hypothetical protein